MRKIFLILLMFHALFLSCNAQNNQKYQTIGEIDRIDPQINSLIPEDAVIEILSDGFEWSEGPVWVEDGQFLLFNDIPTNTLLSIYLRPAGYSIDGNDQLIQFGCNGLFINPVNDQLVICEHGNHCLSQLNKEKWIKTTIVDNYEGKRFNSPNDVVISSKGQIYFTDPPYGLKRVDGTLDNNPFKELNFSGVFHFSPEGQVTLVTKELDRPNGIGLSPDEKTLYVANSGEKAILISFDVAVDGATSNAGIFFDATSLKKAGTW